jgi:hypothetical protein
MFGTLEASCSLCYPFSRRLAGRATVMIFKFRMKWVTSCLFPVIGPCFLSSRTRPGLCCSHLVLRLDSSWNVMAHVDAREGNWRGNWRKDWVASTLHITSERGVYNITTADAHTSAASSRLNWRPYRFKWTRPFRRKAKSGFCACAITFQLTSKCCLFAIRAPCLIDWFQCLLLVCLVANIVVIWIVTFSPVFFYLFVQMDYWFSVWLPLLLPSFCVIFLAAKVLVSFEVHTYITGPHLTLRESKLLLVGRIPSLQMYCGPQVTDSTNLVTRLDINFCFPQNNKVISRISSAYENASFLIFRRLSSCCTMWTRPICLI